MAETVKEYVKWADAITDFSELQQLREQNAEMANLLKHAYDANHTGNIKELLSEVEAFLLRATQQKEQS